MRVFSYVNFLTHLLFFLVYSAYMHTHFNHLSCDIVGYQVGIKKL